MNRRAWFRVLGLSLTLGFAACSSFERDWRQAAQTRAHTPADPFGGPWDGQWSSEKHRLLNGQPAGGRLRCIFTRLDEAHYRADFRANWLIFASGFKVNFKTERRGRVLELHGEEDLGAIFGGVYRYEGQVTPGQFSAAFASRYDHGRFEMTRPR